MTETDGDDEAAVVGASAEAAGTGEPAAADEPGATDETAAEESDATDRPAAADRADADKAETAWQRRKRLAAVFGDVLPDATRDERGPDPGMGDGGKGDDWYRSQVPPHHG
ncbi:hypothetical protein ASG90_11045 [Nocardioides sp. Soil797]|nr:hypothetical protein ASG90_11045 [Nocardioides sp. Soil797]